jgi:hypothetical protein
MGAHHITTSLHHSRSFGIIRKIDIRAIHLVTTLMKMRSFKIDRLVYDLYGLTEDEIAVVEGNV